MTLSEYWEYEDTRSESSLADIPPGWLLGRVVAQTQAGQAGPVLHRVREVLSVAVQLEAEGETMLGSWRRRLPRWFVNACDTAVQDSDESSMDEGSPEDEPWPLESWTAWFDRTEDPDRLARSWRWWHAETQEKEILIVLCIDGFPCPVGSLRWLLLAAGATSVSDLQATNARALAARGEQPRLRLRSG